MRRQVSAANVWQVWLRRERRAGRRWHNRLRTGGAPVYNPPLLVHPPGDGSPNWHLRAGPGKHFRSLGGVEPGAYVRVLETDCTDGVNTWARIGYGALTGWIHGGWALGINACI